uniref:FAD-binding domain-containing protein n=1 Tax=Ditylenchus dipsaci TaxID=166011 RepID=A0A915EDV9_9BILA
MWMSTRATSKISKWFEKAVIVGAGPIGLYSAFQLFLAGINVTLVNDRPKYARNQVLYLNADWIFELRLLLGTNPNPVNTSIFDLIQYALDKPAVKYQVLGHSAILVAVGDAAASPHFYSSTGLATGKKSVNSAIKLIKDYNNSISTTDSLINSINTEFQEIKKDVLENGKPYVEPRLPDEIDRIAVKSMCSELKK